MLDIVKRRYLYFAISLTVIIPGLIALIIWGLPLAHRLFGRQPAVCDLPAGHAPHHPRGVGGVRRLWSDRCPGADF